MTASVWAVFGWTPDNASIDTNECRSPWKSARWPSADSAVRNSLSNAGRVLSGRSDFLEPAVSGGLQIAPETSQPPSRPRPPAIAVGIGGWLGRSSSGRAVRNLGQDRQHCSPACLFVLRLDVTVGGEAVRSKDSGVRLASSLHQPGPSMPRGKTSTDPRRSRPRRSLCWCWSTR